MGQVAHLAHQAQREQVAHQEHQAQREQVVHLVHQAQKEQVVHLGQVEHQGQVVQVDQGLFSLGNGQMLAHMLKIMLSHLEVLIEFILLLKMFQ